MADPVEKLSGESTNIWGAVKGIGIAIIGSLTALQFFTSDMPPWATRLYVDNGWWFLVGALAVVTGWYFIPRDVLSRKDKWEDFDRRLAVVSEREAINTTKIDLFYEMLQVKVGQLAKGKTHLRLDYLLDKYRTKIATEPEMLELQELLGLRSLEDVADVQSAAIALALIYVAEELVTNATHGTLPTEQTEISPAKQAESVREQHEAEQQQVEEEERKPPPAKETSRQAAEARTEARDTGADDPVVGNVADAPAMKNAADVVDAAAKVTQNAADVVEAAAEVVRAQGTAVKKKTA